MKLIIWIWERNMYKMDNYKTFVLRNETADAVRTQTVRTSEI